MPNAEMDTRTPEVCAVCERSIANDARHTLYGHGVCKKCRNSLLGRRELAFVIDYLAITFSVFIMLALVSGYLEGAYHMKDVLKPVVMPTMKAFLVVGLLLRDSILGVSIGKLLTDLRVVDVETHEPIGPWQSVLRNLIVLVPIMPFVIAVQMRGGGKRLGDGWAKTKVIRRKYADRPIFGGEPAAPLSWGSR